MTTSPRPPDDDRRSAPEEDLPDALEGEELDTRPGPDQFPSDTDVQAERPPDDLGSR